MTRTSFLATLLTTLLLLVALVSANPVAAPKDKPKNVEDFHFKPSGDAAVSCPASNRKLWEGKQGTKFGILCGWDTKSHTYHWGPLHHLTFEQCMKACGQIHDCTVATYTGNCYLKKNAKGKGYFKQRGGGRVMTAIKLARGGGRPVNGKAKGNGKWRGI